MAEKTRIVNIAGVGIIFRESNPSEIFLEVKDDGHPIKLVRRQLCFIGGNWIGKTAKDDRNTLHTFRRELGEELSFDRPVRNSVRLALLGMADIEEFAPTPDPSAKVTEEDTDELARLKRVMVRTAIPFGDFLNTIPKAALDAADPQNKREGFTALCSYWQIPLGENNWARLVDLQTRFNNLSNESITVVTSLEEIIRTDTKTAFGHDWVLKEFFLDHGLKDAENLPLVHGTESVYAGMPMDSYNQYLRCYDVARHP